MSFTAPFKFNSIVRFIDTDKYGHVNNSIYFTYFEEARTEWVYSFKKLIDWGTENSIQFVIAEQSCKYILPLLHPNKIETTQSIKKFGAASIEFSYELRIVGTEQILTTGNTKLAFFNAQTNRLQKIPTELRQNILNE
jgi:acyl-CoA thioester hydrolase